MDWRNSFKKPASTLRERCLQADAWKLNPKTGCNVFSSFCATLITSRKLFGTSTGSFQGDAFHGGHLACRIRPFNCSITDCVCCSDTTLQIGNTHEYTVWRQKCCLSRANGVIAVVSGPSMVSVVFRLVRSWFLQQWLLVARLFVARFWLADVG